MASDGGDSMSPSITKEIRPRGFKVFSSAYRWLRRSTILRKRRNDYVGEEKDKE